MLRPWPRPLAAIGTLPHQHGPMVRVGGILSNQCLLPAGHSLEIVEWLTPGYASGNYCRCHPTPLAMAIGPSFCRMVEGGGGAQTRPFGPGEYPSPHFV